MIAIRLQDPRRCSPATRRMRLRAVIFLAALATVSAACAGGSSRSASAAEPWGANAITPAEFAKELAGAFEADRLVVVCTAPAFMYRIGHIPGAVLHGPASSPEGLRDLTTWAQDIPRSRDLVIYCGCCPLSACPNLRPAYAALRDLGFTRVRVLLLPTNFKTDWVDRGYPFER